MDIQIQEAPKVAHGDLILVDDMMRGRKFQVAKFNGRQVVDGKEELYPVALFDLDRATIHKVFSSMDKLQTYVNSTSHSVKSQKEYQMYVRRK